MRAYVSTQTLHPQWTGYGYTWRREWQSVREQQFARGPVSEEWLRSPFYTLVQRSAAGERERGCGGASNLGPSSGISPPSKISIRPAARTICAWASGSARPPIPRMAPAPSIQTRSRRPPRRLRDAEIELLHATLPELSLAMKAHAGYDIASGLLRTYLGNDAGSRVHAGAVERGSVNSIHSVLWYADLGVSPGSATCRPGRKSSRC